MTDKDGYLVLYQPRYPYEEGRRSIYFVEWMKGDQMKLIDKIEWMRMRNVYCLPNSNDLIVRTSSLVYNSNSNDLIVKNGQITSLHSIRFKFK